MVPFLVGFLVEAERLLPVRLVRDDGFGAAVFQPLTQLGAVVSFIAKKLLRRFRSANETFCDRAIVSLTTGQEEGKKTAFSIRNCVDFRIAPAARASNRLLLLPPFPPDAERCALI